MGGDFDSTLDKGAFVRIAGPAVPISVAQARRVLGPDVVGLEEVARALGLSPAPAQEIAGSGGIPWSEDELEAARSEGEMLVLRLDRDRQGPLTIQRLIELVPAAFEPQALTKVGYSLRDEWGITLEPLARAEVCAPGWHLSRKEPLPSSCNLPYYRQEDILARFAARRSGARRRTAVEATFDLIVYHASRGQRLLASAYDWTSSRTVDAGYLYVGGFGESGMSLAGFSAAVRHASLGVCPTRAMA